MINPQEMDLFTDFYRQLARRIRDHIEYERDMSNHISPANQVLSRFDIRQYVDDLDAYFEEQRCYQCAPQDLFPLLLTILVPPPDISALLSRENRKRLFAGVLENLCLNTDLRLAELVRLCYQAAAAVAEPFNGQTRDSILELYKESIEILDRDFGRQPDGAGAAPPQTASVQDVLTGLLQAFSIRSKKDMDRLLRKAGILRFVFAFLFCLLLIVPAAHQFRPDHPALRQGLRKPGRGPADPARALQALLAVIGMANILVYSRNRVKKRYLIRAIRMVVGAFKTPREVVDTFFKGKFQFDVHKLLSPAPLPGWPRRAGRSRP